MKNNKNYKNPRDRFLLNVSVNPIKSSNLILGKKYKKFTTSSLNMNSNINKNNLNKNNIPDLIDIYKHKEIDTEIFDKIPANKIFSYDSLYHQSLHQHPELKTPLVNYFDSKVITNPANNFYLNLIDYNEKTESLLMAGKSEICLFDVYNIA